MSQIFAGIETPFINTATLKRVMSNRQKDNIFQGVFTRPNEACTEKYSDDVDAAEIQVIRVKPKDAAARELGADVNGAFFNSEKASQPATAAYPIRIITTIDDMIDIPTNMQGMINVDLAEAELANLYGRVDRNVNALTMAAQIAKDADVAEMWLTHYSPSLTKPEEYMDEVRAIFPRTVAAKDGRTMELVFTD